MDTNNEVPQKDTFGGGFLSGLKKIFIFLFRAILILLVVAAIGTAIYFGGPVLINEYLLKDVKVNSNKIQEIDDEMTSSTEFLGQRLIDLQSRIESLEIQTDTDGQVIDNLQVKLSTAEAALQEHDDSIADISPLADAVEEMKTTIISFEESLSSMDAKLELSQDDISNIELAYEDFAADLDKLRGETDTQNSLINLQQELELIIVMELVTRVRVSMILENYGSAKDDLNAAQGILTSLSSEVSPSQAVYLGDILQRLALAVDNLTSTPGLVQEDLEVAWQLLLQGLPNVDFDKQDTAPTPTKTPDNDVDTTPTATPTQDK